MTLSQIDYIRAAIAQAMAEDLTLTDLWHCAEGAASCEGFADAVNLLAGTMPSEKEFDA